MSGERKLMDPRRYMTVNQMIAPVFKPSPTLQRMMDGETLHLECPCGVSIPMTYSHDDEAIVIDHGGEIPYKVTVEALKQAGNHALDATHFVAWLDRVHEYQGRNADPAAVHAMFRKFTR